MRISISDAPATKRKAAGRKKSGAKSAKRPRETLVIGCNLAKAARSKGAAPRYQRANLELADQPELTATVLDSVGTALLNRGCLVEGGALLEQAYAIRLRCFGATHPATALSLNSLSRLERERGEYKKAQTAIDEALTINRTTFGPQSLPVAISLNELGALQLKQGNFADAEKSASDGFGILTSLGLSEVDPNTTRLLDIRGRAEAALGKRTEAEATYKQLLPLDEKQIGTTKHPKYATHLANSGLAKAALGRFDDARAAFQTAINLYEGMGLDYHPNLIDCYANLGALLRMPGATAGDLKKAGVFLEQALSRSIFVRGKAHVLVGNDYANRGRWLYASGDKKKAASDFSTALKIYEQNIAGGTLPAGHFFIAEAQTWKGRALVELGAGAAATAEKTLREAIKAWPAGFTASKLGTAIAQVCLGRAIYLQRASDPDGCRQLAAGFKLVTLELPDPRFVETVKNWRTEQGCSC